MEELRNERGKEEKRRGKPCPLCAEATVSSVTLKGRYKGTYILGTYLNAGAIIKSTSAPGHSVCRPLGPEATRRIPIVAPSG
jgi:hypothetical protein